MEKVDFQTWQVDRYSRLHNELAIDMMRLEKELSETPSNVQEVCEWAAKAVGLRDEAKLDAEIVRSMASRRYRSTNSDERGKQPSEARISTDIPSEAVVIDAEEYFIQAELNAARWQALVRGWVSKDKSLDGIVRLTVSGYMAPSSGYEMRKEALQKKRESS